MKKVNEEKLQQLEAKFKDAVANLGESEVRDAMLAKADFFARIGDKENADKQYRLTAEQTVGSGQKLDVVFTQIRLGLFWMDHDLIKRNLEKAKAMVEAGSDWDRKNRLKVYEAVYHMSVRNFKQAALLFLETISTFTAVELLEYQTYIFYTVLMAVVSLDRVTLKDQVINAPEILAVIENVPSLSSLMNSLYNCQYAPFFVALAAITDTLKTNRFLAPHAGFYCKEMRVIGYSQLLESYRSVQLESMATAFGVSVEFLDRELSRFIATGRLHCKVDKVGGIVETNRPDSRNAQYQTMIKQGDDLLNRVQKLSRVINL
jgi:26S proteasome regulatory subunit N7